MNAYKELLEADVLVIGTGIAGLTAAAEAASGGKTVIAVSKGRPGKACNSILAGGYFRCATDSYPEVAHGTDTLNGGRMLNDKTLVATLVRDAPAALASLVEIGLPYTLREKGLRINGDYLLGGASLTPVLVRRCLDSGVRFIDGIVITGIIIHERICRGAAGLDKQNNAVAFRSSTVVLATGGAAGIFRFNDNAPRSYGEGYALALDAGLELIDMEFVQFYPLIRADCGSLRMLLPSVLADQARITNRFGEDLKEKYKLFSRPIAQLMRDRFSRAIFTEIRDGNGVAGAILMDMRNIDKNSLSFSDNLLKRFDKILQFDVEPLKIRPAAHFSMGGIKVDTEGRTALRGLYAVGEVAGGVHGANRLGGNALSEAVVFGTRCAKSVMSEIPLPYQKSHFDDSLARLFRSRFAPTTSCVPSRPPFSVDSIGEVLWKKAGIIRSDTSLKEALAVVDQILQWISESSPKNYLNSQVGWSLRSAALSARAVVASAIARTESRGAHYREDFPQESTSWSKNVHVRMQESGLPDIVTP